MEQVILLLTEMIAGVPSIIVGILLFILTLIVAAIVKKVVISLGKKLGMVSFLEKRSVVKAEEQGRDLLNMFGSLSYLVVFLIMVPSALTHLGMESVAEPIVSMAYIVLRVLPNILGAGIILFIGYLIAKIVKEVIVNILRAVNVDEKINQFAKLEEGKVVFTNLLGSIVFAIIFIPVVVTALDLLKLEAISKPAVAVMAMVFTFIPNIVVSAIMVGLGLFLAKLLGGIINGVLVTVGVDRCSEEGCCAVLGNKKPSIIITNIVKALIVGTFAIEAINALKLPVLSNISNALLGYMPNVFAVVIVLAVSHIGLRFIGKVIENKATMLIVKVMVYVFVGFMILNQLAIAPAIVSMAFMFVMGAISIAFILAFGLGGKDFAKAQLDKINSKLN